MSELHNKVNNKFSEKFSTSIYLFGSNLKMKSIVERLSWYSFSIMEMNFLSTLSPWEIKSNASDGLGHLKRI